MATVWVLLTITCMGHVNSKCTPSVAYFPTEAACEEQRQAWGWAKVCFPAPKTQP